ncbi:MAG: sn-glycerol-3-phosphate ABC transporter ATP-binding protein UgpC [Candidatus Eisenbacteria bacterium]|nr:sn-glycerol-3-phosphate ABC transporter ATP-binding protein UgpC [Candidatus Eisenbacteria bacterium]
MAGVVLKGVAKTYPGGVEALQEVSLEIHDREFLVLVGPSGCGKSTILRMVAGLEDVTRGEIWIGDRMVNAVPPRERNIAMVFQSYALYPHMTAYGNIAFGLRLRRLPKAEVDRKVRNAAEILGITPLLEKPPKALSGGERQRVALGRAIVRSPQVFLFDEPLSNLDAKLRSEMRAEISTLHKRLNITTIYVTHDQVEAMTMGERIAVMDEGRIQQIDEPLAIYRSPKNRFVAEFIGSPTMNVFDAEVSPDRESMRLGGETVPLSPRAAEIVHRFAGKRIWLGIRPENVGIASDGELPCRVRLVEPMGGDSFIYGEAAGTPVVLKAPIVQLRAGAEIRIHLDQEEAHFFDPASGERIGQ